MYRLADTLDVAAALAGFSVVGTASAQTVGGTTDTPVARKSATRPARALRKAALALGALTVIGMGGITVACGPQAEPAETIVTQSILTPTEKAVRTNVTRAPSVATPIAASDGNAAVPCGFGPAGGARCDNRDD